jgi:hypothetical protein
MSALVPGGTGDQRTGMPACQNAGTAGIPRGETGSQGCGTGAAMCCTDAGAPAPVPGRRG